MGQKGNLAVFEGNSISETGKITPIKLYTNVHFIILMTKTNDA